MFKRKLISVLFEILKDKDNYLGDTEPDEDEELNIDSSLQPCKTLLGQWCVAPHTWQQRGISQ